jgi:hypothetical protein
MCGAVSYRLAGDPMVVRICWCRDCQRLSANGSANAIVATAALAIEGHTAEFTSTADSGNAIRRRFCPQCGSHLFANSAARPQFTAIRIGTLDDPSSMRPTLNMWSASAPAWACLDSALQRFDGQPPPPTIAPKP